MYQIADTAAIWYIDSSDKAAIIDFSGIGLENLGKSELGFR